MTSFTFSAEQVKSAPPEVRRWIENEVTKALALQAPSVHDPSKMQASALAACTIDEVAQLFNLISGNFLVTQVFFELARETPLTHILPSLHALNLSDMQRHVQLTDGHVLFECLSVINQALQRIRNDADASLFGRDESGHVYVHETTHRNIRRLREQLVLAHSSAVLNQPNEASGAEPEGLEAGERAMQPEYAFGGNGNASAK
jgi:hypothetical protein